MSSTRFAFAEEKVKDKHELKKDLDKLEFQVFRMQDNLKEIAKKWQVIGIDQTHDNKWVIIYAHDDGNLCKIMLADCDTPFQGTWDFSIQAKYSKDQKIHIGDIKGEENRGYGSICMDYLKDIAKEQNIQYITGDLAERDWDHLDRLVHFYKKHNFHVEIDYDDKSGEIKWNPMYE